MSRMKRVMAVLLCFTFVVSALGISFMVNPAYATTIAPDAFGDANIHSTSGTVGITTHSADILILDVLAATGGSGITYVTNVSDTHSLIWNSRANSTNSKYGSNEPVEDYRFWAYWSSYGAITVTITMNATCYVDATLGSFSGPSNTSPFDGSSVTLTNTGGYLVNQSITTTQSGDYLYQYLARGGHTLTNMSWTALFSDNGYNANYQSQGIAAATAGTYYGWQNDTNSDQWVGMVDALQLPASITYNHIILQVPSGHGYLNNVTGDYQTGLGMTLIAWPNASYVFTNFTFSNGTLASASDPYVFTIGENVTINANFALGSITSYVTGTTWNYDTSILTPNITQGIFNAYILSNGNLLFAAGHPAGATAGYAEVNMTSGVVAWSNISNQACSGNPSAYCAGEEITKLPNGEYAIAQTDASYNNGVWNTTSNAFDWTTPMYASDMEPVTINGESVYILSPNLGSAGHNATMPYDGVVVIDATNHSIVWSIELNGTTTASYVNAAMYQLLPSGESVIWAVDGGSSVSYGWVKMIDYSNKSIMTTITLPPSSYNTDNGTAADLCLIDSTHLAIAGFHSGNITIWDISNPLSPVEVYNYNIFANGWGKGNGVGQAEGVLDVKSDPNNPYELVLSLAGTNNTNVLFLDVVPQGTAYIWTQIASSPVVGTGGTGQADAGSAVLNGLLYMIGGYGNTTSNTLANVTVYNPANDTWTQVAPLPTASWGQACDALNGQIYCVGGSPSVNVAYNPATNSWSSIAQAPSGERFEGDVGVADTDNGGFYVVGGCAYMPLYAYFPANDSWVFELDMSGSPQYNSWSTIGYYAGTIYVLGGAALNGYIKTYTVASNTLSMLSITEPIHLYGALRNPGMIGPYIPIVDGFNDVSFHSDVAFFNVVDDTFVTGPNTIDARDGIAGGVIGGTIYVTGGRNQTTVPAGINDTEKFNVLIPSAGYSTSDGSSVSPANLIGLTASSMMDAALVGSPAWISPYGMNFTAASSQYVNVSSSAMLGMTSGVTMEAWFRFTGTTGTYQTIMGRYNDYWMLLDTSGKIYTQVDTSSGFVGGTSSYTLSAGSLYHIVVDYGGSANATLRLYINGSQQWTSGGSANMTVAGSAGPFGIGDNSKTSTYYLNGVVYSAALYNVQLTDTQITADYNAGAGNITYKSGTVGIWRFDEGSGSIVYGYDAQTTFTTTNVNTYIPISQQSGGVNSSITWSLSTGATFPYDNGTWKWGLAAGNVTTWRDNTTGSQVLYLTGAQDATQYTITFANDGHGTVNQTTGLYWSNQTYTVLATPSGGYQFLNFVDSINGNSSSNPYTFTPTVNATITAYFTQVYNHITFATDGQGTLNQTTGDFVSGSIVNVLATPNLGYAFQNFTLSNGTVSTLNPYPLFVESDITITAHFSAIGPDQYYITFATSGSGSLNQTSGWFDNASVVNVLATPVLGNAFVNFTLSNGASSTSNPCAITVSENMTVTAYFTAVYNHIVFMTSGSGMVNQTTGDFQNSTVLNILATPGYGYAFVNFTLSNGTVTTSNPYAIFVESNITVTANFDVAYNHIVFATSGSGSTNQTTGDFAQGDTVTVLAIPNGSTFDNFTLSNGTASASNPFTFTVSANMTVTAYFTGYNYLTFATDGHGMVNQTTGNYLNSSSLTILATPNGGYSFVEFVDSVSGTILTNPYTLTVSDNRTITAYFNVTPPAYHRVVFSTDGHGSVNQTTGDYVEGSNLTLLATPDLGYAFANFTLSDGTTSTSNPFSFSVGANMTVTAYFAAVYNHIVFTTSGSGIVNQTTGDYQQGTVLTVLATPSGSTFDNFTLSNGTTSASNPYAFTIWSNVTVTAYFTNYNHITFLTDGHGSVNQTTGDFRQGTVLNVLATPNVGWSFLNFTLSDGTLGSTNPYAFTVIGNLTVIAYFNIVYHHIVFTTSGSGTVNQTTGDYQNSTILNILATPSTGYTFANFTLSNGTTSTSNPFSFSVGANMTVTAYFNVVYNHIVFTTYGPGSVNQSTGDFANSTVLNVLATPNNGCVFLNFTLSNGTVSTSNPYGLFVESNITLTAYFAQAYNHIVFTTDGHGNINQTTGDFVSGSIVKVLATSSPGYSFLNFTLSNGTVAISNPYAIFVESNITVTAYFTVAYNHVIFATDGHGTVNQTTGDFPNSTILNILATPNPGYTFANFTLSNGTTSTANPYGLFVGSNMTVTAYFNAIYHRIVFSTDGHGSVNQTTGDFQEGLSLSLLATPYAGYTFANFTLSNGTTSTSNPFSFSVGANMTVTAYFNVVHNHIVFALGSGVASVNQSTGDYPGGTTLTVLITLRANYHFSNATFGNGTVLTTDPFTFTVTRNDTITAYGSNQWYVTFSTGIGGSDSGTSGWYTNGTRVSVRATASANYAFKNWVDSIKGNSTANPYGFTVTGNATITSYFVTAYYVIFTGVRTSLNQTTGWYPAGVPITVLARPNGNYVFANFTDSVLGNSTKNPYTFTPTVNRTTITGYSVPRSGAAQTANSLPDTQKVELISIVTAASVSVPALHRERPRLLGKDYLMREEVEVSTR